MPDMRPDHEKYWNVNAPLTPSDREVIRSKNPPKGPPEIPRKKTVPSFSAVQNVILSDDSLTAEQKSRLIANIGLLY